MISEVSSFSVPQLTEVISLIARGCCCKLEVSQLEHSSIRGEETCCKRRALMLCLVSLVAPL